MDEECREEIQKNNCYVFDVYVKKLNLNKLG